MEELSGKKWKDAVGTMVPFCWYYRSDPSGACAAMLAVFARIFSIGQGYRMSSDEWEHG